MDILRSFAVVFGCTRRNNQESVGPQLELERKGRTEGKIEPDTMVIDEMPTPVGRQGTRREE
jgi:hypothetical protein